MLSELRVHVLADVTVASLVTTRMYPVKLPQNVTYPALSYNQVSGVRIYDLCGPTGRTKPRISINSWAENYSDVLALAAAVRRAMEAFRGRTGGSPDLTIDDVKLDNEIDLDEPEAGTVGVYRRMQDYVVSYLED